MWLWVYTGAVRTLVFPLTHGSCSPLSPQGFWHATAFISSHFRLMTFLYSWDILNSVFPFPHGGYYLVILLNDSSDFFFKCFSYFVEMTKGLASSPSVLWWLSNLTGLHTCQEFSSSGPGWFVLVVPGVARPEKIMNVWSEEGQLCSCSLLMFRIFWPLYYLCLYVCEQSGDKNLLYRLVLAAPK